MADVIPRFGFRVQVGVACEQGTRREVLQDAYLAAPELGFFAIADGMGGHQAGELASREALSEVHAAMRSDASLKIAKRYFEHPDLVSRRRVAERLRRVVERAHAHVRQVAKEHQLPRDIGTTLDVIWLLREEVFVAHVGDSRAYVVRSNAVLQLTEDHSSPLARAGEVTTGRRTVTTLLYAVGVGEVTRIDTVLLELRRFDRVVLASDGVWAAFDDESELGSMCRQGDVQAAAAGLVTHAARKGSFDDRTTLIVEIQDRFAKQATSDSDAMARDITPVAECALFHRMTWPRILTALSVAVHVEFGPGESIPHFAAGDRVAYVILDGVIKLAGGRSLGSGATLFAESLVGSEPAGPAPTCEERVRAIRIRCDDFQEICRSDPSLAAELYRRLAEHLGRRLGR